MNNNNSNNDENDYFLLPYEIQLKACLSSQFAIICPYFISSQDSILVKTKNDSHIRHSSI